MHSSCGVMRADVFRPSSRRGNPLGLFAFRTAHTYSFPRMPLFASRLCALIVVGLVSLSAPSLALLHGLAHQGSSKVAAQGQQGHRDEVHHAAGERPALPFGPVLHHHDAPDGHDHPSVSLATSGRPDAHAVFLVGHSAMLSDAVVLLRAQAFPHRAGWIRAGPSSVTPRQPRAPPLG